MSISNNTEQLARIEPQLSMQHFVYVLTVTYGIRVIRCIVSLASVVVDNSCCSSSKAKS
jgi:hypothetical protein